MRFQSLGQLGAHAAANNITLDVVDPGIPLIDYEPGGLSVGTVWRLQPSIRKVVSFIAANIASIPLHVYRLESGTDRVRVRDGAVAALLSAPSKAPGMTPFRFWERILIDGLLHDRWAIAIDESGDQPTLVRIPPRRFRFKTDGLDRVTGVKVIGDDGETRVLDPEDFLLDVGYAQLHGRGTSPVETLRALLQEAAEGVEYRRAAMRKAALHTGWIGRETAWPSQNARANFLQSLRAFQAKAEREGGTMLLDEGMTWHDRQWQPADLSVMEARRLTDEEVATAYHIAPEILGIREGNYSNLEAFRQSLYRDALGPYISAWEQAIGPIVERLQPDEGLYIEAHLDAKLRGSFETQASVLQTATGRPYLTTNEARARLNLPALDEGDGLVTPLNVLVGGQASPTDSGSQNERAGSPTMKTGTPPLVKSGDLAAPWGEKAKEILQNFFARQGRSVTAAVGAKADWWDRSRWDRELAADLFALADSCVKEMGRDAVRSLGFDPDEAWSQDRVQAYLRAVSEARARWVNEATRRQVEAALDETDGDVEGVFVRAEEQRAGAAGAAFTAAMAGFAVVEAAKQAAPGQCVKEWVTFAKNPRSSHLAMNGEIVPAHQAFSNGMQWPGDPAGGGDEVAGCTCTINLHWGA